MFLAIREIRHSKLHSGLIVAIIALVGYLIFMLLGLMLGLAKENTAAIEQWHTQTVVLSKGANLSLSQSLIKQADLPTLKKGDSLVGQSPVVISATGKHAHKQSAQLIGLKQSQPLAKTVVITSGHRSRNANQLVLSTNLQAKGYRLSDKVRFAGSTKTYTVVGFASGAMLNMTPVIYGDLSAWQGLKGNQFAASAIFSTRKFSLTTASLKAYPVNRFVAKLPGYAAQNKTFAMMIAFLMVIAMVIIAVFLTILTMQKLPAYAVLRAQGITAATLSRAAVAQAFLLMGIGSLLSLGVTFLTTLALPTTMPFLFSWPLALAISAGLIVLGMVSALVPVRLICRLQPLDAMS